MYALASRVIESRRMTTSSLCSVNRLAFSITISATWTWREGGSSNVLATTSPLTVRRISVTSSGLSSISKTINRHSGLFLVIDCAMFCRISVLPALGGDTINPRCPLPIGAVKSITRALKSSVLPLPSCSANRSLGNKGVRFSNRILFLELSGLLKLISLIFNKAKYLSPSFGGLIFPATVSPVRKLNRRI